MAKQKEAAAEAPAPAAEPAKASVSYYTKEKDGRLVEASKDTEGALSVDWSINWPVEELAENLGVSPQAVARVRPE